MFFEISITRKQQLSEFELDSAIQSLKKENSRYDLEIHKMQTEYKSIVK